VGLFLVDLLCFLFTMSMLPAGTDRSSDLASQLLASPARNRGNSSNGRSRSPPGGAPAASHDESAPNDLEYIYIKATDDKLPVDLKQRILAAMKEYKDGVLKKVRIKDNLVKMEDELSKLRALKDPNGCKPFRANEKEKQLDEFVVFSGDVCEYGVEIDNGVKIHVEFPGNPTHRDLLRGMHYGYNTLVKRMQIDMEKSKLPAVAETCRFENFLSKCHAVRNNFEEEIADLDLGLPDDLFVDTQSITEKTCKSLIQKIVESIVRKKRQEKEKQTKLEERKEKAVTAASQLNPIVALNQQIKQVMQTEFGNKRKGKGKGKAKGNGQSNVLGAPPGLADVNCLRSQNEKMLNLNGFDVNWASLYHGGDVDAAVQPRVNKRKYTKKELSQRKDKKWRSNHYGGNANDNGGNFLAQNTKNGFAPSQKGAKGKSKGKKGKSKGRGKGKDATKGGKGQFYGNHSYGPRKGKGKGKSFLKGKGKGNSK